ncbi:30S ribosomal protein S3 [Candidatus Poseidonia alphae]|uniref:30S ribosomal protein S3 n=1 Tax=Candidatus Poseidonia alphae TaxID=1915863 RepID=UPI0023188D7E|nr:30S ribosomal protein S3 [Candidatus Poseidonia alphae]MDA8638242.1 30S ribosomal protein S3 [Candidatus Poseidonia alphae]MDA8749394.1 30S ribosomal protein S3 [Candidatus Poseidonia alphae]MDA8759513.1 30S ribosomal protein S3 [Candidatus Poseidonia alphae]MDA8839020.1 30S ribosomal protein S3 [Candidatus Poseidonia alphae]
MSKKSIVQTIINRNVERQLVREFLMKNTKKSGFGGLEIRRTPAGTDVTVHAERPGMVIGRKGKIINDLQSRLSQEFELYNPKLKVEEVKKPVLNAQVMAEKIAASLERGWYHRRACHSAAQNIMDAGARGVIVTVAGKLTGSRNRTEKYIRGHVKYCGETALQHMDKGYSVAVKKLGTIGVTVQIMRPGTKLPHEITIFSEEELKVQAAQAEIEGADAQ